MAQNESPEAADVGERTRISEAERRERLKQLVLRRSKLSTDEAAVLRDMFPELVAAYHDRVWNRLRRRGLEGHDAEDLYQEVFLGLHNHILEHGFRDNLPKLLHTLIDGKHLNHVRARRRAPISLGLPPSSAEEPRGAPDVERALDLRELARRLVPQLSPEHQEVIDKVILHGLSLTDTAAVLQIPEGTVKSRIMAAKRALLALAEPFLPPSQRGPT